MRIHSTQSTKKSANKSSSNNAQKSPAKPRPVLRWIGGKGQLLEPIGEALPLAGRRWIEPFVGSGIVAMAHGGRCEQRLLADANGDLITLYRLIRDDVEAFIEDVSPLFEPSNNVAEGFKAMKLRFNELEVGDSERARLFFVINRHGFNGLIRYNKKGELNVSYGKRKSVPLHVKHLRAFSAALQGAELVHCDFREAMRRAGPGDIVYCDPPYISTFTSYTSSGFTLADQADLAAEARAAAARGATVIISNTDCSLARDLYIGAQCRQVTANRCMSPKAASRGRVHEVLAVYAAAPQEAVDAAAQVVVEAVAAELISAEAEALKSEIVASCNAPAADANLVMGAHQSACPATFFLGFPRLGIQQASSIRGRSTAANIPATKGDFPWHDGRTDAAYHPGGRGPAWKDDWGERIKRLYRCRAPPISGHPLKMAIIFAIIRPIRKGYLLNGQHQEADGGPARRGPRPHGSAGRQPARSTQATQDERRRAGGAADGVAADIAQAGTGRPHGVLGGRGDRPVGLRAVRRLEGVGCAGEG